MGTHETNNSKRNTRCGTLLKQVGVTFGLPASSVYYHPSTYIRPLIMVLNQGLVDAEGKVSRCAEFRDQYVTIAPKTVCYGDAADMTNQYEHVLTSMHDMIENTEEGKRFKGPEGAVKEKKGHALKLHQDKFTIETAEHELSFLKCVTRLRLLMELM